MALKFYSNVAKGVKLKVRMREVVEKKLVKRYGFLQTETYLRRSHPSWIELTLSEEKEKYFFRKVIFKLKTFLKPYKLQVKSLKMWAKLLNMTCAGAPY